MALLAFHLFVDPAPEANQPSISSDSRSDDELASQAVHGAEAFAELYRRHARQVYWYLLSRTSSPEDAEDLTQHVFLRALEALPGYQCRGAPFRSWLLAIARNAAVDVYRRRRRLVPFDRLDSGRLAAEEWNPEARAVQQEDLDEIGILIARLDPQTQELLRLRLAANLSIAEIGGLVGKSEAAVRKQLQRAVQSLREQWNER